MDINTWLVFFSSYLVITLSPGPNVVLVLKNALQYGYRTAFISIFANLSCQLLIVCSVGLGIGALIEQIPLMFLILKVLGGGYLIYLGLSTILKKKALIPKTEQGTLSESLLLSYTALFKEGCFVSISNPKTVLFLSAFLPQFLNHNEAVVPQFAIMFFTIALCVFTVHLTYAFFAVSVKNKLAKRSGIKASFQHLKKWLDRVTAGVFILMGGSIILSQK